MANTLVLEVIADASGFLLTMDAAQQAVKQFIKGAGEAGDAPQGRKDTSSWLISIL
jgi:hypothetical protein